MSSRIDPQNSRPTEIEQARGHLRDLTLKNAPRMSDPACPVCRGLGFYFDPAAARHDRGGFEICECIRGSCRCGGEFPYEYYDAETNAILPCPTRPVRLALDKIAIIGRKAGIPPRYQGKFLEYVDFNPGEPGGMFWALDHAAHTLKDFPFPEERRGLYIHGQTGSGKTLLSCVILNEIMRLYRTPVKYAKISRDVLGKLRSSFNPNSPSYGEGRQIEEELGSVPALVIDDFGIHKDTDWVNSVLYDLIDARYENNLLTILTSNEPLEAWKDVFNGRLYSRMKSMCAEIEIDAPDYRLRENERSSAIQAN